MRSIHAVVGIVCPALLLTCRLAAEVPPQSREEMERDATHVVAGTVTGVYARERPAPNVAGGTDTAYLIELKVADTPKGDGPRKGEVVYVRTWRAKDRPRGWTGPGGQTFLPKEGEPVRAHLRRADDGGYDALIPSGIQSDRESDKG